MSSSTRSRRRSLRVPLDEVPRGEVPRGEVPRGQAPAAPEPAPSPPPKQRSLPPPPPPEAMRGADALDPARTTDPGSSLDSAELSAAEIWSDDELGQPIDGTDPGELENERTTMVREDGRAVEGALPGEKTSTFTEHRSPVEPTTVPGASAPAMGFGLGLEEPALDDERATSEMVAFSEASGMLPPLENIAPQQARSSDPEREEPSQLLEVTDGSGENVVEEPPSPPAPPSQPAPPIEARASQPPPASAVSTSTVGIVMQRTIAIGVSAPTAITTAQERASMPPMSEPAFELSESEIDVEEARDSKPAGSPDATLDEKPADKPAEKPADELVEKLEEKAEDKVEELEELDVEADARAPRSAPPPPPAGGPPPPPARPPPPPKAPAVPATAPPAPPVPAVEDTGKRARKKWWEEFFNDDYFRTVPLPQPKTVAAQAAFIASRLGLRPGSAILDVGCGLGVHAVELTKLGYTVVGLDLSLPMLSRAADEAQDHGLKINFIQGDMREMQFESLFDAVISWGTTFGYFDDDQNRLVVERLHRALKPGGLLLLDVVNRDYVVRSTPNSAWFQGDGCVVMEETTTNYINSRLTVKRQVMLDDGRQNETVYTIRLYSLHELGQILHQRGFRVVEVSGREATPGVFFGADSPRLIIVAERRADLPASGSTPSRRPEDGASGDSQQIPAVREPKDEAKAPEAKKADAKAEPPADGEPPKSE